MYKHYLHKYRITLLLLLLIVSMLIQACAGSATEVADTAEPEEPIKLNVALLPFMSHAPLFFAQAQGYYAEQGLEVEFQDIRGPEASVALGLGDLDVVASILGVSMFALMENDENVKIVAGKGYVAPTGCTVNGLIARKDLVDGGELDSVAQLEGRTIAMDPTNLEGYYMEQLLATAGLTLEDIEFADLPSPPSEMEALGSGAIDLSASSEPWITRTNMAGNTVTWNDYSEQIPGFQFAVLLFGPNLLNDNPDAGRRFMTAYVKAIQQYNLGKTERNMELMVEFSGLEQDLLEQICWPTFRDDGSINLESVLDFQDWIFDQGLVETVLSGDRIWDASFVEAAN